MTKFYKLILHKNYNPKLLVNWPFAEYLARILQINQCQAVDI